MQKRLKKIKLLLLDVDGVLTDGGITYTDAGEQIKQFNAKDGLGIRLLMNAGIQVGIITGRKSGALVHRCRDLGLTLIFDGIKNKADALREIADQTRIGYDETAFMGDDLIDLPAMKRVGICFCPADAAADVKSRADFVTGSCGGTGAVREICEKILKARGLWDAILENYLS